MKTVKWINTPASKKTDEATGMKTYMYNSNNVYCTSTLYTLLLHVLYIHCTCIYTCMHYDDLCTTNSVLIRRGVAS